MTTAVSAFRWLDVLESEFDKAYVDLDLILNDFDSDQFDLIDACREKMQEMSSAWAQLVHKSQTIFQVNCKLEVKYLLS
jgi:golgi-associated PDZ and coiled-coil motif-containing protein